MVYIFLAEGFEESEAVLPRDILKRGGVNVKTVGVTGAAVQSAYGLKLRADILASEADFKDLEAIILPGGMPGTENLAGSEAVSGFIDYCFEKGVLIAAICAAPSILGKKGLLSGKKATCYPGFEKYLTGAEICGSAVVRDGNIITSKGPGTAMDFGFEILKYLKGETTSESVKKGMLFGA